MIRRRINRAEDWARQITELMEQRDTSSGLTFSLRWKPCTAAHEEEMDTRDLVELLRSDTLYYRREGEQRKELTNNVFYTFSGGEKAMANCPEKAGGLGSMKDCLSLPAVSPVTPIVMTWIPSREGFYSLPCSFYAGIKTTIMALTRLSTPKKKRSC